MALDKPQGNLLNEQYLARELNASADLYAKGLQRLRLAGKAGDKAQLHELAFNTLAGLAATLSQHGFDLSQLEVQSATRTLTDRMRLALDALQTKLETDKALDAAIKDAAQPAISPEQARAAIQAAEIALAEHIKAAQDARNAAGTSRPPTVTVKGR